MAGDRRIEQFQSLIAPHLAAAYNYARWLARSPQDAEDVVQEACVRAIEYIGSFRTGNGRAWLLTIVRNTFLNSVGSAAAREIPTSFEDEPAIEAELTSPDAHTLLLKEIDIARLKDGIESLPHDAREAIVLREIEGLSYKEISEITRVPIGTVMSRLARARSKLQKRLNDG